MSELKSCKCGEKPGLFSFFRKAFGIWKVRYFYVRCPVCKRRIHNAMSKEKAIEAWNRRVTDGKTETI